MHNSTAQQHPRAFRRVIRRASRKGTALAAALFLGAALVGCSSSSSAPVVSGPPVDSATSANGPAGASTASPGNSSDPAAGSTDGASPTAGAESPATTAAGPTTVAPTTAATTTTTAAPTTTLLVITEGGVVLVANASGIDGAATQLANRLAAKGYATVKATNAAGYEESLDVSKVYFTPDAYPVAYSIAQIMGVEVAAMPTPPPISYATDGLRGANVIVMLGHDFAGQPISGLPDP